MCWGVFFEDKTSPRVGQSSPKIDELFIPYYTPAKKYSHGKFPSFLVNTNKMVEFPLLCYFTPQEKLQNEAILQQQHNHPQAALLELQGLARGQERMLLSRFFWLDF